jgi:hypothetical protein
LARLRAAIAAPGQLRNEARRLEGGQFGILRRLADAFRRGGWRIGFGGSAGDFFLDHLGAWRRVWRLVCAPEDNKPPVGAGLDFEFRGRGIALFEHAPGRTASV